MTTRPLVSIHLPACLVSFLRRCHPLHVFLSPVFYPAHVITVTTVLHPNDNVSQNCSKFDLWQCTYNCELKKKKETRVWHQSSQNFKKISIGLHKTKLISVHDSIHVIILLSFSTFIVQSYSAMDGCTAINLWNTSKLIVFVQVGDVCAAWWHLQELSQQSNNSYIRTALCTITKLGQRQFWHALQKLLLSSHLLPNMNDQSTIWKTNKYAIIHWFHDFSFWESTPEREDTKPNLRFNSIPEWGEEVWLVFWHVDWYIIWEFY